MTFFDSLWNFLLVSSPYLLMGLLFSGVIHSFISVDKLKKYIGKNKMSDVFWAAAIGVPLPLCSCSVIPTAVTLRKSGASTGATSAFLISTPESGVDSILMTYAMMDWPMTIMRPVAAFCSAFLAGFLNHKFNNDEKPQFKNVEKDCCAPKDDHGHQHDHDHAHMKELLPEHAPKGFGAKLLESIQYAFSDLLRDMAFWLIVGILCGALINHFVPQNFFMDVGVLESRLMILLVGIPLYICASASTPIAASLMMKGLSPGSALLFLLAGPATNVSNIVVLQKYIGKRGMIFNLISISVVAIAFSFIADYLYAHYFTLHLNMKLSGAHDHLGQRGEWWEMLAVTIFLPMLLLAFYHEDIKPRLFKKKTESCCH